MLDVFNMHELGRADTVRTTNTATAPFNEVTGDSQPARHPLRRPLRLLDATLRAGREFPGLALVV